MLRRARCFATPGGVSAKLPPGFSSPFLAGVTTVHLLRLAAAPLAALLKDPARKGKRFAVILSGGNIDRELYLEALGSS